jgi:hypothetical protein
VPRLESLQDLENRFGVPLVLFRQGLDFWVDGFIGDSDIAHNGILSVINFTINGLGGKGDK